MTWRYPDDRVEYVVVAQPGPGNLRAWDSDEYWWIHCNFFIHVPPKINSHFVTTFLTPEGELRIAVSPSINGSAWLVSFRDEIADQLHNTYYNIFRPYSYLQQREMLHPSSVGVCRLIRYQDLYFLKDISTKRSGQWYWFWIFCS